MNFFDLSTLIPLIVAVIIFMKLRNVLGTRTGHQGPPKHMPKTQEREKPQSRNADNVVTMPQANNQQTHEQEIHKKINAIASSRTNLNKNLKAIYAADNGFDPEQFMQGAKAAYEMVITSFAEGDLNTLKPLLNKEVYDNFASAIKEREAKGEVMISNFIGIIGEKFTAAQLEDDEVKLTVKFTTEMISALTDKNDEIIEGDPNQVIETVDEWTFARSLKSQNPNWVLIAT